MQISGVAEIVAKTIKKTYNTSVEPEISYADPKFGDFSTNVAFALAAELKDSPFNIAKTLDKAITHRDISKVEAAQPGFINITMTDSYWRRALDAIDEGYLLSQIGKGKKLQVEFISANPTGPLTLGNARGGFIGDVLSNVLEICGYSITREYYFNDSGTQIAKLAESYETHLNYERGEIDTIPEDTPYKGEYMKEVVKDTDLATSLKASAITPGEAVIGSTYKPLVEYIFTNYVKPALDHSRISFDKFTNERVISQKFDLIRKQLDSQGLLEEREGALWLKSTEFGDQRDRVLVKSSGDLTYFANDIAYHYDIFRLRRFDKAIKVWGADHAGQVPSLKLTVDKLFPGKEIDFITVQWVRLIKDGEEFKVSKRAGTYVTVEELIERVGADVARWFMLMRSNDTHMDFDLDLAEEQSQKNPFWYVMYAYVRAGAIIAEAAKRNLTPGASLATLEGREKALVRQLSQLPGLVASVAASYEVHRLTFYGLETAKLFHDWYESVKVVDLPAEEAARKLYLLTKFQVVMKAYFNILGIEPYEKM